MKNKKEFVTIKCTKEQAFLIEQALDIVSRITCGQLYNIVYAIESNKGKFISRKCPDGEKRSNYSLGDYIEKMIKPILFPELHQYASYGVGQKQIGKAQIMYEMVKILQNYRAIKDKHTNYSVTYNEPLHYSKEPLIEVKEV